jgi:hypothetical protein
MTRSSRASAADSLDEPFDPGLTPRRRWRLTPGVVMLAVALVGSIGYGIFVIRVRDASSLPLLASGAAVLGIVFIALAAYCLRATWLAGLERRNGRAVAIGLAGGIAAFLGAGCIAAAIIAFLLAGSAQAA